MLNKFLDNNGSTIGYTNYNGLGSDEISADANLYFNTMFFDPNYIATTGVIDNKDLVNAKRPRKKRIGIDKNGRLTSFSENQNSNYNDVLQEPISFTQK